MESTYLYMSVGNRNIPSLALGMLRLGPVGAAG